MLFLIKTLYLGTFIVEVLLFGHQTQGLVFVFYQPSTGSTHNKIGRYVWGWAGGDIEEC
jgi:hypothetical protein